MTEYLAILRYYPGDPLEEILKDDLKKLEKQYGVTVSYERIENRKMKDGLLMENTMEKHIEEISQEIITVSGNKKESVSDCIRAIYKKYRCPRTSYSLLGSNEAGQAIAKGLMHLYGGWE
jgi:hypothetical protein